jgi:hypothetical protein
MRVFACVFALATFLGLPARADDDPEPPRGLTARIVVKSKLPLETNLLQWELLLTNQGKTPLRVCTLCGGWGSGGKGGYERTFAPDLWKSDRPSPAAFAEQVVTLKPGQSVALPMSLGGWRGEKYTITARYQVGKDFAARHKTWQGTVKARAVEIRAVMPREK